MPSRRSPWLGEGWTSATTDDSAGNTLRNITVTLGRAANPTSHIIGSRLTKLWKKSGKPARRREFCLPHGAFLCPQPTRRGRLGTRAEIGHSHPLRLTFSTLP